MDALLRAAASDVSNGQVYNLGGDSVMSLKEVADILVELHGSGEYAVHPFPAARKRIDIGDYYADDSRIRSALGWEPRVGLREGLARTLEYYRNHLEHYVR